MRLAVVTFSFLAVLPFSARAHEGHAEAPGEQAPAGVVGSVLVSAEARRNLGLETAEAELRPIESTLSVVGAIAPVPALTGTVASRISGRVVAVLVAEGDSVRRGQPVVEVESLLVGDPPPRVRYASPLDGTVIGRHVVAGESIEPNGHLLDVANLAEVLAVGRVFEGQVGRVRVGQSVRVAVPSFAERSFEGVVERLGGQLDAATQSLPLYVRVKNPDGSLRPNMRALLTVVTDRSDTALAVPRSALFGDFGASFLFVEDEEDPTRFERRAVVTGVSDDRWIEIVDGVLPGDRVVTVGGYSLQFLPPAPEEEPPHAEGDAAHAEGPDAATPAPARTRSVLAGLVLALGAVGVSFALVRRLRGTRSGA